MNENISKTPFNLAKFLKGQCAQDGHGNIYKLDKLNSLSEFFPIRATLQSPQKFNRSISPLNATFTLEGRHCHEKNCPYDLVSMVDDAPPEPLKIITNVPLTREDITVGHTLFRRPDSSSEFLTLGVSDNSVFLFGKGIVFTELMQLCFEYSNDGGANWQPASKFA